MKTKLLIVHTEKDIEFVENVMKKDVDTILKKFKSVIKFELLTKNQFNEKLNKYLEQY